MKKVIDFATNLVGIAKGYLNKFKLYLIAFIVLLLISAFFTVKILIKENKAHEKEIIRLENNQFQTLSDNLQQTELTLKQNEVIGRIKKERDSLALIVKVKPKQITKIITIDNSTHDTTRVPVEINLLDKNTWMLIDSGECFKYVSKLILEGSDIIGERQLFEYNNKTIQTFYKMRPYKFLFIRFGRWQYKQVIDSKCGEQSIKTINFVK